MPAPRTSQLEQERAEYRASIAQAIEEDEDPLAAYDDFIKWTSRTCSDDPNSSLVQLLEEATRKFKDDVRYSGDLRYLKIWCSYAKVVEKPSVVYAYLVKREIGCVYAQLWEEYALSLEKEGRHTDADKAFRAGISRSARPIERLKRRYRDFQARPPSSRSRPPPFQPCGVAEVDALRRNPFKNHDPQPSSTVRTSQAAQSSSSTISGSTSGSASTHARYAPMLAPPAPGRRPEKLRFNLSLLFTPSGVEYSAAEVRARSMGLLGKKWGPPAASELRDSSAGLVRVKFNDDGSRSTQNMGATASGARRKSVTIAATGEPTVTINTKEALADVFGMYNSPDKTVKRTMPGSKHAPVRKIEPMSSRRIESLGSRKIEPVLPSSENENVKPAAFKPFVDENAGRKERPVASQKFKPFVEEPRHPSDIPPPQGRRALSLKESAIPPDAEPPPVFPANSKSSPPNPPKPTFLKPAPEEPENKPVFSKPFTPVSQKEPLVRPSNTKSSPDELVPQGLGQAKQSFTPFVDAKTPFKVFSRPPSQGQGENGGLGSLAGGSVFTPKPPSATIPSVGATPGSGAFRPFVDDENAVQPVALQVPSSSRRTNALQPRAVPVPPTIEETYTDESSLGEGAGDGYGDRGAELDGHAFSSSSSHTNFSESEDGYVFEGGEEEPEAGIASSSDSQIDEEEGAQHEYAPEHAQEAVFSHFDSEEDEEKAYREPLGGRFGKINVMTPITERTFEFSTRGLPTPTSTTRLHNREWRGREGWESGKHALEVAQQLAREVQEDMKEDEYQEYQDEVEDSHAGSAGHPHIRSGTCFSDQNGLGTIEERTGTLSLSDSLAVVAAFRPPNPCVPTDPVIISTLLSLLPADEDFYDLRTKDAGVLDGLQRFAAKKARGSKGGHVEDGVLVTLEGRKLRVTEKLGEGGFGAVFSARDISKSVADEDEDEDEDETTVLALKVVKPRNLWEFHVLRRVHRTLPALLTRSIVSPLALYAFRDESHLLLELCQHGTLLDIVNRAGPAGVSQQGACLDELLVFFYTIELLKFVEGMHTTGFIHGDLKIDNCLLRIEDLPGGASSLSAMYQPSGEGGWKYRGIKVIDFGRTIDTTLFPAGHSQQFIADWPTDDRDCLEIRQSRPWRYQTDYFGLAGIVYCMLFGRYMDSAAVVLTPESSEEDPVYKIATPFKRYWQSGILTRLFDLLLNPCRVHPDGSFPICEELAAVRTEMEMWLQSNCNRSSNTLKGLLKKIELSTYTH